jgi:bifunctional UDP-N-acetylglucosamine pyrophosphorylase / glucosamine-1-phosphate N-acetyltransferase
MEQSVSSALPRRCLALVLAAGEGTRMRSDTPKVLHEIAGLSLIGHVLSSVSAAGADQIVVVVGPDRPDVEAAIRQTHPQAGIVIQRERKGTAHACLIASEALASGFDDLLVVFGDTPLVLPQTYQSMRQRLAEGGHVVALGFEAQNPQGYGRLIMQGDRLLAIREHKDCSEAERAITLCNAGLMAIDGHHALSLLRSIGNQNSQNEYYLTDAVAQAVAANLQTAIVRAPEPEVMGVNDRVQLAQAEQIIQNRLRLSAMQSGVTMHDPASVYLSYDTVLQRDVVVEPHCVFGVGVMVGTGSVIHAFSHLAGCHLGPQSSIGPFARVRPGTITKAHVRIGNFVEVKNARLDEHVKINHLSYVGDASVGAYANIGAGTITCNYDGFNKHRTEIGAGAFIGSDSALVAPVSIGDGAYVATGSVITESVPADALAFGRARQVNKPDRGRLLNEALKKQNEPV